MLSSLLIFSSSEPIAYRIVEHGRKGTAGFFLRGWHETCCARHGIIQRCLVSDGCHLVFLYRYVMFENKTYKTWTKKKRRVPTLVTILGQ